MDIRTVNIPIKKVRDDAVIPEYKFVCDAGCDLVCCDESVVIPVGKIKVVHTGIAVKIPWGFEGQIRPRSGMAIKKGISVVNTPGTIDSDYTGEIMVGVINLGERLFTIRKGDRFAQLVFSPVYKGVFHPVEDLESTLRGEGGIGHTGV